jgi:hypothetical protein
MTEAGTLSLDMQMILDEWLLFKPDAMILIA